jgi:hypothetical protein
MKQISLTGRNGQDKYALVDDDIFEELNQFKWRYQNGYAVRSVGYDIQTMHNYIMGNPKGSDLIVDHMDWDRLNNQRSNLRLVTRSQNNTNKRTQSKSGYRGVGKVDNKWRAQISVKGNNVILGLFTTAEEAANAYNSKAVELFGDCAILNNIEASKRLASPNN